MRNLAFDSNKFLNFENTQKNQKELVIKKSSSPKYFLGRVYSSEKEKFNNTINQLNRLSKINNLIRPLPEPILKRKSKSLILSKSNKTLDVALKPNFKIVNGRPMSALTRWPINNRRKSISLDDPFETRNNQKIARVSSLVKLLKSIIPTNKYT